MIIIKWLGIIFLAYSENNLNAVLGFQLLKGINQINNILEPSL
jgi:hypothetical protein